MVTGGESYFGLRYGVQDTLDSKGDKVSYYAKGGFGFFKFGMFLDTHFSCRGRDGRMIALLRDLSGKYKIQKGVGMDENTALVVEGSTGLILGA
jgi:cyanophycinase